VFYGSWFEGDEVMSLFGEGFYPQQSGAGSLTDRLPVHTYVNYLYVIEVSA
jgi:hypothetical protein